MKWLDAKVDSIENVFRLQQKSYQLETDTLDRNLTGISDTIHLQEKILHDEIKGVVRGDDRTTGKAGEGPTFKYDTAYLNRLYYELAQTKISNERIRRSSLVPLASRPPSQRRLDRRAP